MRWTGPFLIVLALSSLGCARRDWISNILTIADVTGTWEGQFRFAAAGVAGFGERTTLWVLQQNGAKVRGEVQGPDGASVGSIEGMVNGEVFSWSLTGQLRSGRDWSGTYHGEVTVNNSDELNGRADGPICPCTFLLRRVNTNAVREKQQM